MLLFRLNVLARSLGNACFFVKNQNFIDSTQHRWLDWPSGSRSSLYTLKNSITSLFSELCFRIFLSVID